MNSVATEPVLETLREDLVPRFVGYAEIDTLSDPETKTSAKPSTDRQWDLIRLVGRELEELGVPYHVDENGYVYGKLAGNASGIPITLVAHVDTADAVPQLGVKPLIHDYQGGVISYPDDPNLTLDPKDSPLLANYIGSRVITASGKTLLGADDKAGMAEIMSCLRAWTEHPELPHPDVYVCFTHDEEIGHGVDEIDLNRLSKFCYTLDGGKPGSIEIETWNAYKMTVTFGGVAAHAGAAKGKMVNSIFAMAEFIRGIGQSLTLPRPEDTEGRDGFVHVDMAGGNVEATKVEIILRDFDEEMNKKRISLVQSLVAKIQNKFPDVKIEAKEEFQYPNMKTFIDAEPEVARLAIEAIKQSGLEPHLEPIRGGTDGSRLSAMGHPCPNLGTGMAEIHSTKEWVAEEAMVQSAGVILNLGALSAEAGS